ncbi:MAG TPA: FliH/SctL family protein [Candidatus Nitrosotalea sp.]|nr:FliH/SctL family protein [Candidatus Nitrosotalea sp.]
MSDAFVPLTDYLRPAAEPSPAIAAESLAPAEVFACHDCVETLRGVRRFRAGLADAVDAALPQLLDRIAREVLGRELRLAGADLAALVEAALERFEGANILRLRANPADLSALAAFELERVGDPSLQSGDVRIELTSGSIDLSFESRLAAVLRAWG